MVIINREYLKGTTEAVPGLRVSLMVQGDRQGYKCFAHRAEGVIESVDKGLAGSSLVRVKLDTEQPYVGTHCTVLPTELTALEA